LAVDGFPAKLQPDSLFASLFSNENKRAHVLPIPTDSDFNPILGETYEWIDPSTGFKYLAEQVRQALSAQPTFGSFHHGVSSMLL
jgi:hypothetical protein